MSRKLHLGCGQRYMEGYVNIDYPLSEHSVQTRSVADKLADLTKLRYSEKSIEEVRLHHVFEHFLRQDAIALLASWNSWLVDGGTLHIEVPDFNRTALVALNPRSSDRAKGVALRHIFGSNEAHWAVHYEGWSEKLLKTALGAMGFSMAKVKRNSWKKTHNIEVIATKQSSITQADARKSAKTYLHNFTLDDSKGEQDLLKTWMKDFDAQLAKTWAKKSR